MTVSIVQATMENVEAKVNEALDLIGYQPQKDAIFIKPNVPSAGPADQGLFTDPRVVEALVKRFSDREIVIGEGCLVGYDAFRAFQRTGYAELAERYGLKLVDLNQVDRYEVGWRYGILKLPLYLQTHEYINVAKLKTHIQTGVTLGLKNQKGLLLPEDKKRFHKLDLNDCIQALAQVVRPDLTLVDGIVGLEGDGPWRFGAPKQANLLIAGQDVVEVDDVCLRLMGFDQEHAPHIPPRDELHTVGLSINEARQDFAFDYKGYIQYKNLYEHITDSCSGCNWVLYQAMREIKKSRWKRLRFMYRGVWRRLDLVSGHGPEGLPAGHGKVICVGDCARRYAKEHRLPIATGCPPDPEEVAALF